MDRAFNLVEPGIVVRSLDVDGASGCTKKKDMKQKKKKGRFAKSWQARSPGRIQAFDVAKTGPVRRVIAGTFSTAGVDRWCTAPQR